MVGWKKHQHLECVCHRSKVLYAAGIEEGEIVLGVVVVVKGDDGHSTVHAMVDPDAAPSLDAKTGFHHEGAQVCVRNGGCSSPGSGR